MNFIGEEEFVDRSKKRKQGGRPQINRKTKVNIVFDPEARRKFLTGFRKRKQERKERYQEKLEKDLAEEKQKAREEAKKSVAKKQSSSHSILPEVRHLIDESDDEDDEDVNNGQGIFEMGNTTVCISSLSSTLQPHYQIKMMKTEGFGANDEDEDQDDDEDSFLKTSSMLEKQKVIPSSESYEELKLRKLKEVLRNPGEIAVKSKTETLVKKETQRLLQHSTAFKKALRMKQKNSKKFKLNRLQPQEEKEDDRVKKKKGNPKKKH